METMTRQHLRELAGFVFEPAVTIYQSLHGTYPETQQDPIRFRDLLDQAEQQLTAIGTTPREMKTLLANARKLQNDDSVWKSSPARGLAVFMAPRFFRSFRLPYACLESVDVGGNFYVTPLVTLLDEAVDFHILALSPKGVRLYRCSRGQMTPVELPVHLPKSLDELFAGSEIEKKLQYRTSGGFGLAGSLTSTTHGHGDPADDKKLLSDELFHKLAGLDSVLEREELPLVLAGVKEHQVRFRNASRYVAIVEDPVLGSADELSEQELYEQSVPLVKKWSASWLGAVRERCERSGQVLKNNGQLKKMLPAAASGRIDILLVARDCRCWGSLNGSNGESDSSSKTSTGDIDLIDFAVRQTLLHNGEVHAVPSEDMPGKGIAVAIMRW